MRLTTARLASNDLRQLVRRSSKRLLGVLALFALVALATAMPGLERLWPISSVSPSEVITAGATAIIVWLLCYLATELSALSTVLLDGPASTIEHIASIVFWLVLFVAILVGYHGFAAMAGSILGAWDWIFDLIFFLMSVPVVAIIAARVYVALDPAAEHVTNRIVRRVETPE